MVHFMRVFTPTSHLTVKLSNKKLETVNFGQAFSGGYSILLFDSCLKHYLTADLKKRDERKMYHGNDDKPNKSQ